MQASNDCGTCTIAFVPSKPVDCDSDRNDGAGRRRSTDNSGIPRIRSASRRGLPFLPILTRLVGFGAMFFLCASLLDLRGHGGLLDASSNYVQIAALLMFAVSAVGLSLLPRLYTRASADDVRSSSFLVAHSALLTLLPLMSVIRPHEPAARRETIYGLNILFVIASLVVSWSVRNKKTASRRARGPRNVLIVGADPVGREVRDYLAKLFSRQYSFKGFVSLGEGSGENLAGIDAKEIVGDAYQILTKARTLFVDEIIFSQRPSIPNLLSDVIREARTTEIDIRLIPSLTETLTNRSDVQYIGDLPTISIIQTKHPTLSLMAKRAIDIVLSLVGMLILLPVLLIIALVIKLDSKGPVLYRSSRVGYKGTVFNCFKFRTMSKDAEALKKKLEHLNERKGVLFKIAKDPRITRVGALLRKYSLDELPQLWNVLVGDMSLVGPRPSISSEVAQYETHHLRRLDVVPGITGLWQVEGRQDPSFESYITLDSKYVNDWSIWLDLKILLRTVNAVISGTGA